jgi:flagellar biosynthesis protein FliP
MSLASSVADRGRGPRRLTYSPPAYRARRAIAEFRWFAISFALCLLFVTIDWALTAALVGLGIMMLSPPVLSLPVKLLLFVMFDGWALLCGGVAGSFR